MVFVTVWLVRKLFYMGKKLSSGKLFKILSYMLFCLSNNAKIW